MDKWIMCVVALILGMLMFHMLKDVCGCKTVEGNNHESSCGGVVNNGFAMDRDGRRYRLSSGMCDYLSRMSEYYNTGETPISPQQYLNEMAAVGVIKPYVGPSH